MTAVWARTMRPTGTDVDNPPSPHRPEDDDHQDAQLDVGSPVSPTRSSVRGATPEPPCSGDSWRRRRRDRHPLALPQHDRTGGSPRARVTRLSSLRGTSSSLASSCKTRMVRAPGRHVTGMRKQFASEVSSTPSPRPSKRKLTSPLVGTQGVSRPARPDATEKGAQHE
jgi:hypothetical protein